MKCPLCKSINTKKIYEYTTAKIAGSLIYDDIIILECEECGHVFNYLTDQDIDGLKSYYRREYIDGRFTKTKIDNDFLGQEMSDNNYIIITQENITNYIDLLIQINTDKFNEDWPTRNFIAIDQWLEHCWNLDAVMQYIRQTLPIGGHVYVSVPDYDRYDTYYYYLIKEHIQHFTRESLLQLFIKHGFIIDKEQQSTLDILNGALQLPIIEYVFTNNKPDAKDGTYCYGAGREFLYMLENNEYFINNTIDGIIDDTPSKHNKKINGIPIISSSIIKDLSDKSTIIITAYYSKDKIRERLSDYKGTVKIPNTVWNI